jgi:hypothetical protein
MMSFAKDRQRLIRYAQNSDENPVFREAALFTQALPVYADIGGVLVISETGEVLLYDPDTKNETPADEKWRLVALIRAARRHPQLSALEPERPHDAVECPACHGNGGILGALDCGTCLTTGWIKSI